VLSLEGKVYKKQVALIAKENGVSGLTQYGPVSLRIEIYRARKAGDIDGYFKGLMDALNGIAWLDDKQVVHIEAWRYDDKKNPRVEVWVEPAPHVK
jgi:Holliday junction resolvase RusA-like endonuclease